LLHVVVGAGAVLVEPPGLAFVAASAIIFCPSGVIGGIWPFSGSMMIEVRNLPSMVKTSVP